MNIKLNKYYLNSATEEEIIGIIKENYGNLDTQYLEYKDYEEEDNNKFFTVEYLKEPICIISVLFREEQPQYLVVYQRISKFNEE